MCDRITIQTSSTHPASPAAEISAVSPISDAQLPMPRPRLPSAPRTPIPRDDPHCTAEFLGLLVRVDSRYQLLGLLREVVRRHAKADNFDPVLVIVSLLLDLEGPQVAPEVCLFVHPGDLLLFATLFQVVEVVADMPSTSSAWSLNRVIIRLPVLSASVTGNMYRRMGVSTVLESFSQYHVPSDCSTHLHLLSGSETYQGSLPPFSALRM
eukprot:CAMPEP_0182526260 /NCGR_PEP_ID=MMETSP1323-20130603/3053_1 /TAXON_ID=236787 /ORGANISM="Florenciella parvula, Strain RCC1693" /LENGTH=209 /DNA_ID=CAMNT_0024735081 /DNA_START=230 /DNA_END=860 /DNA_ORIENTATION=-